MDSAFRVTAPAVVLLVVALSLGLATAAAPALAQAIYNPRYDVNGDGAINVVDMQIVAAAWGTSGNPYNDRELIVAKEGGEYLTVGAAVAAINAAGNASVGSPYVIRVLPGTYVEALTLPSFTHLLGSGEETTIISSTVGNPIDALSFPTATLVLSDQSRASQLTVVNAGTGYVNTAVRLRSGNDATLTHLTARADGAGQPCCRYYFGLYVTDAGAVLQGEMVRLHAQGGLQNAALYVAEQAAAKLRESSLTAQNGADSARGVEVWGSTVELDRISIEAESSNANARAIEATDGQVTVRNSTLAAAGGNATTGAININTAFTLSNSSVTVSGGDGQSVGIQGLDDTGLEIENSVIVVTGGDTSVYGISSVSNYDRALRVHHTSVDVTGVDTAIGLFVQDSVLQVTNSDIRALSNSGIAGYGIHNATGGGVRVESSQARGSIAAVRNDAGARADSDIRNSVLGWGPAQVDGGALTCTDASDDQDRRLNKECSPVHMLQILGAAGQPVFRSAGITYGNAPGLGNWGTSLCLGFATGGANDNASRRLIYPFSLPIGARITQIITEAYSATATGVMTSTLASRIFGFGSNVTQIGQIGVVSGPFGWNTVGQTFDVTLDDWRSYFIQVDFQTTNNMSGTCIGGHRIAYELYGP